MRLFASAWPLSSMWEAARSTWGRPHAEPQEDAAGPEPLRAAMRELLQGATSGRALRLSLAIARSQDPRALWFLRGELMQLLAAERGEAEARRALASLDALFRAGWPQAPVSRSAFLG